MDWEKTPCEQSRKRASDLGENNEAECGRHYGRNLDRERAPNNDKDHLRTAARNPEVERDRKEGRGVEERGEESKRESDLQRSGKILWHEP